MALIAASGGNTARFWTEHEGKKGVFQENAKDDKNTNMKKGGITQENTCGKARSRENKTKKLAKRVHIGRIVLGGMPQR